MKRFTFGASVYRCWPCTACSGIHQLKSGARTEGRRIRDVPSRAYGVNYLVPSSETLKRRRGGRWPAMQQIADWLKKLGMSEYAERFAENDIDMAVLP